MKKLLMIAGSSLLLSLILSCAVGPRLIDSSFIYPSIRTEGIAVLPIGGDVADIATRKDIGLSFEKILAKKYPNIKIVGVEYTGGKLLEGNLMNDYKEVIAAYQMTEQIKSDELERIKTAIGFRYLVIPIVQNYHKEEVKDGNKYTITLESQVWDYSAKKIVFRIMTEGEDSPSYLGIFDKQTLTAAAEKAIKVAVKAFPKPE